MAETHSVFYRVDGTEVVAWVVQSNTPKTWKVKRDYGRGYSTTRTVKMSQIGVDFHVTPMAALTAAADDVEREIKFLSERLQRRRTTLGMIQSQQRKLGLPPAADAVDPSASSTGTPSTRD